jgi:tetratricopeptide (TPR) repeat protein
MTTLHIRQGALEDGRYSVRLTLKRPGQPDLEGDAKIEFALTDQEQEDIRWYLEDYLLRADVAPAVTVEQIEERMKSRGEELYQKVLAANGDTQAIWFSIRNDLAALRVEINSGIAEAASIPWELMRDPKTDSPISLRVKSFVRVQSNPNIGFVSVPPTADGRIRLLYVACRPKGSRDVELRAVANRLLQDLGADRARFDIRALRPPTFEQLQKELGDASAAERPYHIVHFDGHGVYADLSKSKLSEWLSAFSPLTLGSKKSGKHGYLLFEHPSEEKMRPVDGQTLGQLLHDNGVPVLTLNACQSAMHEAPAAPKTAETEDVHEEVRAIGSLAQAVVDQGIPAVLGMRYSVYVVTAAQFIGKLYAALAGGRSFGQAATEGRKDLHLNPDRWVGLRPRAVQDWFVPVVYEAAPIELCPVGSAALKDQPELDPVQRNPLLLRYVPEEGFIGRDETILALDRAFDKHRVVLLHGYAGQGKSTTAVEFARWYALTGALGPQPLVMLASFENQTDLADLLNQIGQPFSELLAQNGIEWNAINEPDKRRQIVVQILRQIPLLWIWDNVEPVAGFPEGTESQWTVTEQHELRDFLHQLKIDTASKVRILLTSRRDERKWLGGIPHHIAIPRMRNADAVRLALKLGEEMGLQRSEIADWQPLLDYCAGNPLTLRVLVGQAVKAGVRGRQRIEEFVEEIRSGEKQIEDADERQGRDKSLGASLDYGFKHAFQEDELPVVALLHLFQGTVDVDVLDFMGNGELALPEVKNRSKESLAALLERAKDIGLLTHWQSTWYTIHPALPWFLRQLFARHYDGESRRSTSHAALHAWAEAMSALGHFYLEAFSEARLRVIDPLALEEANLLHARRLSRRYQWKRLVMGCMQGLRALYQYQGRRAEWAKLVDEIRPDYCTHDDQPISGCEDDYNVVLQYRADIAEYERDLTQAAALLEKAAVYIRQRAAAELEQPADAPLSDSQRNLLRTVGLCAFNLGRILQKQQDRTCLEHFQEALQLYRRIGDNVAEAVTEYNVGHAYSEVQSMYDRDAAEAAYERSLHLRSLDDAMGRLRCLNELGTIHRTRMEEAIARRDEPDVVEQHFNASQARYLEALSLCPADALNQLTPTHNGLGILYRTVGQLNLAREHYERAVECAEARGNRFEAGAARFNMANMFAAANYSPLEKRAGLLRARAYALAALRDFQSYQGRAADDEADAQRVLARIDAALAELPQ